MTVMIGNDATANYKCCRKYSKVSNFNMKDMKKNNFNMKDMKKIF